MYEYVAQHPQVAKGRSRELHYFDWHWHEAVEVSKNMGEDGKGSKEMLTDTMDLFHRGRQASEDDVLRPSWATWMRHTYMQLYPAKTLREHHHVVTLESTPSYMFGGQTVAARIRAVMPHARIIIMMRDPVERAYSHLQMSTDLKRGNEKQIRQRRELMARASIDELIDEDIRLLEQCGESGLHGEDSDDEDGGVAGGVAGGEGKEGGDEEDDGVGEEVLDYFQREYMDKQPGSGGNYGFVGRGLYYAQIRLWLREFPRDQVRTNEWIGWIGWVAEAPRLVPFFL